MIRTALLSKWHVHADDYAKQAKENPNVSIDVVWDEDPDRGQQWAEKLGVPFEKDLHTVLTNSEIDAVIVDTPTNQHKEVILEAAQNHKHIFTEKVLALTVEDCDEMISAIEANDVELMVSLPRLTESYYLYAQEVLDRGWLGELTSIRCRLAHNGAVPFDGHPHGWLPEHFFNKEQCGGGSLIDLGAHPIYLTNRLAGPAEAVTARLRNTKGYEVDDNAVVLVEYQSGALGTLETGFLSNQSPFQLELYGTEGALMIEDEDIRLKSSHLEQQGWITPEEMPESLAMPLDQWVEAIINKKQPAVQWSDARNLTLINEAAALSQQENRRVQLDEVTK
ncbi:MAG TPA: Gfo/Idh/MocA family oxidoreductase [Bacillales bacterium]|nr:Gfo/Idh/MocA family oxidoreductase [Bacillales bacterium]